jgi:WD40 repeat protein
MSGSRFLNCGKLVIAAFAPGNQPLFAGGAFKEVKLWNYQDGELLKEVETMDSNVSALAFTPDGQRLVIGTVKGVVRVVDVAGRKVTGIIDLDTPVHALAASTKQIVIGYGDGTVGILSFGGEGSIPEVKGHEGAVNTIAFNPKGDRFASGSADGVVKVWDTETLNRVCSFEGTAAEVFFITFSPDGSDLIASSANGNINGWNLPSVSSPKAP